MSDWKAQKREDFRKTPSSPAILHALTFLPYLIKAFRGEIIICLFFAVLGFFYFKYMNDIKRRLGYMSILVMLIAWYVGIVMLAASLYATQFLETGQYKMVWSPKSNMMNWFMVKFGL